MKRSIIAAAVFSTVLMSVNAFAAAPSEEQGQLVIIGKVINSSCRFQTDYSSTIQLADVDATRFAGMAGGEVLSGNFATSSDPLTIVCPAGTVLKSIDIRGGTYTAGGVLNPISDIGSAQGVGFKLKLGDSEINDNSMYDVSNLPGAVTTDDNGVYTMHFSAQYARIDAATPVTAGDVRSVLTIAVSAE
ncbi:fimbrial protein [Klebsiella aerogenes]|uniref:fimbrial protein n=1 Tax=Klebsiella aerogenes TaxID=548 RepID=UPI00036325A0|nr:fimbrial protein [Klebsiella aerogenes]ELA1889500.1 fimbrial protein [Klebsiella aerogenes]MBX8999434.1 fimbrial protein [Klebsiella aerogenes]MDF0550407.1 fimbrial protein [Klebsiella aerogenes]MDX6890965.1 fimbrial protein [Klebsiella aerogenes]WFW00058.1 fimbrial protein [Klebsiella aerogenes]